MKMHITFKLTIFLILFSTLKSFAQAPIPIPLQQSSPLDGIKFQGKYYETSVDGFQILLNEADIPTDLNRELSDDLRTMKKKKTIGSIIQYASLAGGLGLIGVSLASASEEDPVADGILIGSLGIVLGGGTIGNLIKPKSTDYYDFINKLNSGMKESAVNLDLKISGGNSLGIGLVLEF